MRKGEERVPESQNLSPDAERRTGTPIFTSMYGVLGQVFKAVDHTLEPLPPLLGPAGSDVPILYTMRELTAWVTASQLLRRLAGVTGVDIDRELAAAGRRARSAGDAKSRLTAVRP
jgi:hypothetical protein